MLLPYAPSDPAEPDAHLVAVRVDGRAPQQQAATTEQQQFPRGWPLGLGSKSGASVPSASQTQTSLNSAVLPRAGKVLFD